MNWSVWLRVAGFMSESRRALKFFFLKETQQLLLRSSPAASTEQPSLSGQWQCLRWAVPEGDAVLALIFPWCSLLESFPLALSCSQLAQQSCPGERGSISSPLPCPPAFAADAAHVFQMRPLEAHALSARSIFHRKSDTRASWKYHPVMGYFSKCPREVMALNAEGDAF